MKKFRSIIMMGFVLLIVTLSKPAMALGLSSFTDVPNFSVVIGDSMYTLDYANNSANASLISAAVAKNKGDVFIKTDDSAWIKNSNGTQVDKDSVDVSTIKYNNGQEIGGSVVSPVITLSDITLTTLTNVDGKVLTAGDTSDVFYAGYIATDVGGNPTTNYAFIAQGLILTGDHMLTTSTPSVIAQLVRNPKDSTKALIKVTATSDTLSVDMPVVITAITVTGKTSQIMITLKKQPELDSFTLQVPSGNIASDESKIIPFIAVDQNGKAITKFSELDQFVTLEGATLVENLDGTASLMSNKVYNTGKTPIPIVVSATARTGKYSTITINVQ